MPFLQARNDGDGRGAPARALAGKPMERMARNSLTRPNPFPANAGGLQAYALTQTKKACASGVTRNRKPMLVQKYTILMS